MNLNCDTLQQLTALEAVGALDGADVTALRERLAADECAREELRRFVDVAGWLATSVPASRPGPSVRERVLARIAHHPQASRDGAPSTGPRPDPAPGEAGSDVSGFRFTARSSPWVNAPLPGVRYKLLSAGPHQQHAILEVELAAGAVYPEHEHVGVEDMYVLTGDLLTEGRTLGPGDSFHADPGTHHTGLRSVGGCTALLIVSQAALSGMVPV
ncbi:MAG: cupin domain-containing protein [Verrucomicrobiales bacterium]|nr:cupin domain-containing protein [Verrucomicrobiales bacterium]